MMCSFQDKDNLYLVMDLLTGGDLRYHICHKKKFSEEQTKFFLACVLLGLEYIHSKNVIHRDIKPENLVCDDKGYIAITDFGVAKKNMKDNSSETSGTPGYMAPEVLCAQNHSFPVDFFAIGVMGYEFMFGVRPYLGRSRKEIKEVVLSRQAHIHKRDKPSSWSYEAVEFINSMLQRKPNHRLGYNGIEEVKAHAWFDNFDWEGLLRKKIKSPFQPRLGDNFDKKYCEGVEKIGTETQERYSYYMSKTKYATLFNNYTYMCPEAEELANKYTSSINNSTVSTATSGRKLVSASSLGKYVNSSRTRDNDQSSSNSNNYNRILSPSTGISKGYQFPKEPATKSSTGKDSRIAVQQQRPLSRLTNSSSSINIGIGYRNYNNNLNNTHHHQYNGSYVNYANMSKTNMMFDLNKMDLKSTRFEKKLPVLSKNSSMKFLGVNSSYMNGAFNNVINSNNSNKRFTSLSKNISSGSDYPNYGSNNISNSKGGYISNAASSKGIYYRKSSSMTNLKQMHY